MEAALEWFELSEPAINIGVEYSKLLIFNFYVDGIFQVCLDQSAIAEIVMHEKFLSKPRNICLCCRRRSWRFQMSPTGKRRPRFIKFFMTRWNSQ